LIRDLIHSGRAATPGEVEQIIKRMATAPFDESTVHVRLEHRGLTYQGATLGARADALTYHLIKRVVIERQWSHGTTATQYLDDLRRAIHNPAARLTVYGRRGGSIAAVLAPTAVVPAQRRADESWPDLLVIYSADRGIILSGYQFSRLERTGIPRGARWLR
jgi:hypothetical protein